ncbi:uncharacterized protein LY79DRAFT_695675, partial [Colletotrichum navitas]
MEVETLPPLQWTCTSYLSICGLGSVATSLGRRRSSSNSPGGGAPFAEVRCTCAGYRVVGPPHEPASERRVSRLGAIKRRYRYSQHPENTDSGNEIS